MYEELLRFCSYKTIHLKIGQRIWINTCKRRYNDGKKKAPMKMHSPHSFMEMQIKVLVRFHCVSQVALVVKKPVANAGRHKRHRFNPWVRKISCKGDGNPLQYSCLENCIDREARQAAVHRAAQSLTWLKQLSTHPCIQNTTTHMLSWLKKKNWQSCKVKIIIFAGGKMV